MLSDYYCINCNTFFEYKKEYGVERFPEHPACPKCHEIKTRRKLTFNSIVPDHMKSVNTK